VGVLGPVVLAAGAGDGLGDGASAGFGESLGDGDGVGVTDGSGEGLGEAERSGDTEGSGDGLGDTDGSGVELTVGEGEGDAAGLGSAKATPAQPVTWKTSMILSRNFAIRRGCIYLPLKLLVILTTDLDYIPK
jgi:hypothetical protein